MTQYDESNRGAAWLEKERKSDKSPNYTGKVDIGGVPYRIAVWVKTPVKGGDKFLSFAFSPWKINVEKPAESPVEEEIDTGNPFG